MYNIYILCLCRLRVYYILYNNISIVFPAAAAQTSDRVGQMRNRFIFRECPAISHNRSKNITLYKLSIFVCNIFFMIYNIIGGRHNENHACAHDIEKVNIIYYIIMFMCIIGFVYKLVLDTKHTSTKGRGECRTYLVLLF